MTVIGYLAAVTVATLSFLTPGGLALPFWHVGEPLSKLQGEVVAIWIFFVVTVWVVIFVTALPPFAVCCLIAYRRRLRSDFYYGAWGLVTGLMLTPVALWLSPPGDGEQVKSFLEQMLFPAPRFMLDGLCGALAFWYVTGRHVGAAWGEARRVRT